MPDTSNDAKAGKSEPLNRSTLLTRDNLRIARWKPRGARPFRPLAAAKVRVSFAKETMRGELVEAAREQEDELTPTDGGGLRWTAEGNDGCIARVNFPAPSLKSKIEGDGKPIVKIKELAGAVFIPLPY